MNNLLSGHGIDIQQPVDNFFVAYRLRYDLFRIARLHPEVTEFLRINDHQRASFTEAGATGFPDIHPALHTLLFDLLFQGGNYFNRAKSETTGPGTYRNARFILIPHRENITPQCIQFR
jgi:hypothetical protein